MSSEVVTLDQARIDLIKSTVAKGATDLEFELFLHACKHTGLDPLMKQIYAIKRWSQADQREVMSFQVGIDGFRLIADRTKLYAGSDDAIFSGVAKQDDFKATVTIWKLVNGERCAFTASARWPEYVQTKRDGTPTKFWQQMPFGQLGKCAEGLALRKAFPMELSGIYTHEEMEHLDSEWKQPVRTGAEMLAALEQQEGATAAHAAMESPDERSGASHATTPAGAPSTSQPTELENQLRASIAQVQAAKTSEFQPLPIQDAYDRLNAAQSPKEIADVMNAALNSHYMYTSDDQRQLRVTKDAAMKRLGKK